MTKDINDKLNQQIKAIEKEIELNKLCVDTEAVNKEIEDYRQQLIKKQADAEKRLRK
jgi:hypothetical protein